MALTVSCYVAQAQTSALMFLYLKCLGGRFVDCSGDGVFLCSNTSFHGADEKTDDSVT